LDQGVAKAVPKESLREPASSRSGASDVRLHGNAEGTRAEKASSVMSQFHHGAQMRFDLSWFL